MFLDKLLKNIIEGIVFLVIAVFIFNELTLLLQTLNLFAEQSIKYIGLTAVLFSLDNLLSKKFFNIQLMQ